MSCFLTCVLKSICCKMYSCIISAYSEQPFIVQTQFKPSHTRISKFISCKINKIQDPALEGCGGEVALDGKIHGPIVYLRPSTSAGHPSRARSTFRSSCPHKSYFSITISAETPHSYAGFTGCQFFKHRERNNSSQKLASILDLREVCWPHPHQGL